MTSRTSIAREKLAPKIRAESKKYFAVLGARLAEVEDGLAEPARGPGMNGKAWRIEFVDPLDGPGQELEQPAPSRLAVSHGDLLHGAPGVTIQYRTHRGVDIPTGR